MEVDMQRESFAPEGLGIEWRGRGAGVAGQTPRTLSGSLLDVDAQHLVRLLEHAVHLLDAVGIDLADQRAHAGQQVGEPGGGRHRVGQASPTRKPTPAPATIEMGREVAPAPTPMSTTWSAVRIASSSCSTTITVLP